MKKQFLIISIFFAALISELLQAPPPPPSSSVPTMSRVYGNQYTQGVTDSQLTAQVGSLDNNFGTDGSLNIDAVLSGGQAIGMETLSNGNFLVVVANDTTPNTVVAMYNAEGALQTSSYGSGTGKISLGAGTSYFPRATMLDAQGRLLVAGGLGSGISGWIKRVNQDGSDYDNFDTIGDWQFIAGLAQQPSGKIIAVGFNGSYAQIGRYNIDGSLDTTFASSGFVILNGTSGLPISDHGLFSVSIEQSDDEDVLNQFYTLMLDDSDNAYFIAFSQNGVYNPDATAAITLLNGSAEGEFKLILNQFGYSILAGAVSGVINVTSITNTGGPTAFTNFSTNPTINSDFYVLNNLLTTSSQSGNGYVYLIGSNTTTKQMAVIRLDSFTGALDTTFNETGYNFFSIGSRDSSILQASGLAPDGQLYVSGYQAIEGTQTSYVSRLNSNLYLYAIPQFPLAQEQGILDIAFGDDVAQTYKGVVNSYNGKYGPSLEQRAQDSIEVMTTSGVSSGVPPVGDILIGMNGFTNTSPNSNMMFAWLTSDGFIDTTVGAGTGYLELDQETYANEYLTQILQGPSGIVYVCGYGSDTLGGPSVGTILRSYTTASTGTWIFGDYQWIADTETASWRGVGVGYQSSSGNTFIFVDESEGVGHISAYSSLGTAAEWGEGLSGTINSNAYGLHMGPAFNGGLIDSLNAINNLFVAYKDYSDNYVKVAAFIEDGSALLDSFGENDSGVTVPLFAGVGVAPTDILVNNIRCCFNNNGDILVAAINGAGTALLFTLISGDTGDVDMNFGTSGLLTVSIGGSSSLVLKDLTGVSDGTAIATFYNVSEDNTMYLSRIITTGVNAGTLDTSFNSQGSQQGVLSFVVGDRVENYNSRIITSSLIQSTEGDNQGNIVVSAYESVTSNDASPMNLRSFGAPGTTQVMSYPIVDIGTPGTFDVAYDLVEDLGNGAATVVYTYLSGNVHEGYSLIGYTDGTYSKVARYDITTNLLDTTFNGTGIFSTDAGFDGITTMMLDEQNRIVIGGVQGDGYPWAMQIAENGNSSVLFADLPGAMIELNQILQQNSGRYIVAGSTSSGGILVAYQDELVSPASTLAIDETFNPLSYTGSAPGGNLAGSYFIGTTGIYSIAINSNDTILAVYKGVLYLTIVEITADGSGVNLDFGDDGFVITGVLPENSSVCRVALADSEKIVVAAAYNNIGSGRHDVQIQRFLSDGSLDNSTEGGNIPWNIDGSPVDVENLGNSGFVLSDLMETTSNQTIFLGYNGVAGGANGPLFACRLGENGELDPTWNPDPTGSDTPGVLTFATNSVTQMNGSSICIDGRIIAVGQQASGEEGDPIVMYIYGDNYVIQIEQAPLAAPAGTLDYTIPDGSSGSWNLSGTISGIPSKIAIYNNYSNGAIMLASADGSNGFVTMLNADLTRANSATYGTNGVATIPDVTSVNDMYLVGDINSDDLAPIYVTGSGEGVMWGAHISTNGDTITYLDNAGGLTTGYVIRQTNNGRILVAGYNGEVGCIAAFGSVTSDGVYPLDTSFGNNADSEPYFGGGVYAIGSVNAIYDMAVDSLERIYIAYKVSDTTVAVQRLLANGTQTDSDFGATFTTAAFAYSSSQIRLAIDEDNDQLVVAVRDGSGASNIIQVCRFAMNDGNNDGSTSAVTVPGQVLNLSDLFIDAEQNIYVIGYLDSGNSIIARIYSVDDSNIALDTANYAVDSATPGIANMSAGSMTVVTSGAYDPDRRTYFVGSDGSSTGYLARAYGDIYTQEVSEAIATAQVGAIDTSLQPNNTGEIDLSGQSGWSALAGGYKAYAIIENPNNDGTAFIAFGNGTNMVVGKVDADMTPITSFGGLTTGLTAVQTMAVVNSIDLDSDGNVIVAGSESGAQKVVSFTGSGVLNATFASTVLCANGAVVVQQKSGRYIVGSYNGATGLIIAYQNESAIDEEILPVDATFGPAGSNGYYATGVNAQVDDICIDENDNIYFVYVNSSNVICLGKLTANGSGLVDDQNSSEGAFNSGTIVTTGITNVSGAPARIAINSDGNILVGGVFEGGAILTELYNGVTGLIIGSQQDIIEADSAALTKLVGSGTEFYGACYSTMSGILSMSVFAINSSGALDAGFGITSTGLTMIASGSTYEYVKAIYGLSVQADGKLVVVGYNNPPDDSSTFDPSLMRFYGFEYIPQYAQAPDRVDAGHMDTTLWPTTGAFPLNHTTSIDFNTLIAGYSVKRVYEYGNGIMIFVADSGNNTIIFQLRKDLTLDPSFNGNGYIVYSGSYGDTQGLFIDSDENILMMGNYSGESWIVALTSTGGDLPPGFFTSDNLATGYAINQQGMSRVILAGQGSVGTGQANNNGYLLGYNNEGQLDATFAGTASGQLDMGVANPITSIAIDEWDRIIAVSNNDGTVVLQRTTSSGSAVSNIGVTALTGAVVESKIKVVLDNGGRIVVAAADADGYRLCSYANDAIGTDIGSINIDHIFDGGPFVLANIYATDDDIITLVGNATGSGQVCIAQFISDDSGLVLNTQGWNSPNGTFEEQYGLLDRINDAIIHADDRVMFVGSNSSTPNPYMGRAFGYPYSQYITQGPIQGVPGTINPAFGSTVPTNGTFDLSTLTSLLSDAIGRAIIPLSDGGYYLALDHANSGANSILIKTVASGQLDTSYNSTGIATAYAQLGVNSILQDGSDNVVLVGTNNDGYGPGYGWIQRYTSAGVVDTDFGSSGVVNLAAGTQAAVAIEQTLARLVVAGLDESGNGALFAYESLAPDGHPGIVDTTFNGTAVVPGVYSTGVANIIPTLISDDYDRLIFGILNPISTDVDLYRLTPTGQLDITFGSGGVVVGALSSGSDSHSVRVALDLAGNILIAAKSSTANTISIASYDNGTSTATGGNGSLVYAQLNISSFTGEPWVKGLETSDDGYALVLGTQSFTDAAWIARITADGALDTTGFNPDAIGGIAGIFQYAGSGTVGHEYDGLAVNADGTLGMFGTEISAGPSYVPTLVSVYDDPYTSQESQSPDSKEVGTNDVTLGVSPASTEDLGITFFGAAGNEYSQQVARAIGLYDDNNNVVAIDGNSNTGSGPSSIMINMFDNDGIANPNFGTSGSQIALDYYQNQYVRSMVTFTTAQGVTKAILAGYVINSALGSTDSLLMQYVLTPGDSGLDSSFGGYYGSPTGIAFGDGQSLYSVAQQSNGRIIAAGLSQNNLGLFLGYGANGILDNSFGNNGYQSSNTGSTGIYTHAVDTYDRIVFAYNNGSNQIAVARYLADGSALDSSFVIPTPLIQPLSDNTNMKIALDSNNNVYAVGIINSGNWIAMNQYSDADGSIVLGVVLTGSDLGNGSANYVLSRLIIDDAGNSIITLYDLDAHNIVVVRLTPVFGLDTTFNGSGYITYSIAEGYEVVTDAMIHPDGRIIVVGTSEEVIP